MKLTARISAAGYGQGQVLHDVNLEVASGEVLVLLGPNGAGKSTVLNAVLGAVKHIRADVRIDGREMSPHTPRTCLARGIAYVPEGRGIFGSMTVADNLVMCAAPDGSASVKDELLDRFPILAARSRQRAGTLSGGEQQMLAIARALMAEPDFLLVDEPSLGLAPVIVDEVFQLLRDTCETRGLGVVLAEQTQEAMTHADHAMVLAHGHVVARGTAVDLAERDLFGLYTGEPQLTEVDDER